MVRILAGEPYFRIVRYILLLHVYLLGNTLRTAGKNLFVVFQLICTPVHRGGGEGRGGRAFLAYRKLRSESNASLMLSGTTPSPLSPEIVMTRLVLLGICVESVWLGSRDLHPISDKNV